jgi:hypothetical protein
MGVVLLSGLFVLFFYLLPRRRHRTGSYAPSVVVGLPFVALLVLLVVGVLPWGSASFPSSEGAGNGSVSSRRIGPCRKVPAPPCRGARFPLQ